MKIALVLLTLYLLMVLYFSRIECPRHLTAEHNFAHFSKITESNKYFFPGYFFTRSIEHVVGPGEAIWIPKGWWHWIKSEPDTTALSYWCSNVASCDITHPFMFQMKGDDILKNIDDIMSRNPVLEVWDSKKDIVSSDTQEKRDDKCVITLPGYSGTNVKHSNKYIHDELLPHIQKAPIHLWKGMESDIDANLWITLGKHDTGLHYDDNNGVLHVLKGLKRIKLFDPSQSWLLAPLCIVPTWARQTPWKVKYNINNYITKLDANMNFPSARLLYESIKNKKVLLEISQYVKKNVEYVWGCKWQDGCMRWEIYTYTFKNSKLKSDEELAAYDDPEIYNENVCIVSTDFYDADPVVGPDRHRYYTKQDLILPFKGWGDRGANNEPESHYIIDKSDRFIENFNDYLAEIGITTKYKFNPEYECDEICIHNKNKEEIFIQYLGVTVDAFLSFLMKNKYPDHLISHVIENKSMYQNILHEITVVYDIHTGRTIRTAFYGNV